MSNSMKSGLIFTAVLGLAAVVLPQAASAQMTLTGSVSPKPVSYVGTVTYSASASGGDPATTQYAFFRRRPGGTWIPSVSSPNWQSSGTFQWHPTISDVGTWETYIWAKDAYTPASASGGYGYAAGYNTMPIDVIGPPTVPGPTSVSCDYSASGVCWVTGDFTVSVSASSGGFGSLVYQICRSNDTTGWGGCDSNLTLSGGTSYMVSGSHLPSDGYQRAYYFQARDSAGALSGWNTPKYVRVDRYAPSASASNASAVTWYSYRTATISASDSGSGVQAVRYSWNSALDANCTTGSATSSGATLTAPSGDNLLYVCARDNTGRVGQWSGRYRVSPLSLTGSVSPTQGSYLGSFTYTASASGGTPSTTRYAFFRRRPGGTWIPDVNAPNWQAGNTFTWTPTSADTGTWETYIWVKDADTPPGMNTYTYAAGFNTMPITVVGPPTVPGPTTAACAYTASGECWVQGDFTASVTASTGGTGTLVYQICRSNDTTGWGGCEVNLTLSGGTSILVSGTNLPSDGYRRTYYFQAKDSAGALSGWNTPLYVRVDRYAPAVSATNASDVDWYSNRTATVSASDSQSGLQAVRYSWNAALDAGCTTGTATSSGAVLTAPVGDNTLYLCAMDNTGRVGQWSGRYRVAAPLSLTCSVSPATGSYVNGFTYRATASGGIPSTTRYAFFHRVPGGTWIPAVNAPNWQTGNTYTWMPNASEAGTWETYVWVKDGDTPATQNTYGYAAGCNPGPVTVLGPPTVPGPTTAACAYTASGECWVQGDFTASVTASTGGSGTLVYQICRSNDTTGWGGCEVNLTLSGGTSILVSGTNLPSDGYRRTYYFQAKDSAGALSGWNTPLYVRVDRYAPSVSATNASDTTWYSSRTATVSATDTGTGGSGVQAVRYSWNTALDAGCTTGTATSAGAALTAPSGDNTLYLCAKDNTGRVGQWSGRYRISPLTLTGTVSPKPASYLDTVTYTATATGGTPATTQYAFFRRLGSGPWIPDVTTPNWQSSNVFTWKPTASDVGAWVTYIWVRDGDTPATMNTYGLAAGFNTGAIDIVGKPTVPGPTTVACAYTTADDCWVTGDFTASVTASTGGMGSLVYQICRSNDKGAGVFGGCEANLTLTGGTSILVSGVDLPSDGYRRSYWFQAKDSAGALSGWNTPIYVRVDRSAPSVSATNASDSWFSSRTATVSASDTGSGVQAVRYAWNTALDAGCTTGTATSAGATLTAPSGDNVLYLCAKDNTGRVAQWNGRYRVRVVPQPAITAISPKVIHQGSETVLTVTGVNLQEAAVSIGTEPVEGGVPDQVFPTAELLSINEAGTSLTVRIDATEPGISGFYNLAAVTEGGSAVGQFRVVGTAPVVDVYTPSEPVQGNVHVFMVAGANLAGSQVVPLDPAVKVLDLDNSNDGALLGLLYISSDAPVGAYDIRVQKPGGEYQTLSVTVVGSLEEATVSTTELDVPGRSLRPDVPNLYLQEPVSPEGSEIRRRTAADEGGIKAAGSICGSIQASDELWEWSAILLSLSNDLGEPLTREALNHLAPGTRINFNSLTVAAYAWLRYRFFFQWCSGQPTRVSFCVGGGIYYMVPFVGGHGYDFDLCYGNSGGKFELKPSGRITRHEWSTSGSCLDVNDTDPESPSGDRSGEIVVHCCDPTDVSLQTSGTVWNSEFEAGGKVMEVRPESCSEVNNCSKKIEWRYVKADDSEGPPLTGPVNLVTTPDQRRARVTVTFTPEGGSFQGSAWSGGETLATRSGESTNGTTAQVTLTAVDNPGPGSATVTTPTYQWDERLQCTA
ncbi:MAG TPA: hypothetical protein VH394_07275, partial [Thermoanaerobaculia bacterium]|nr:hypothetical protein [Thermoanaerobaculia bacterium]